MSDPRFLKSPSSTSTTGPDPAVAERVSEMLLAIERGGLDAVRTYARDLDGRHAPDFEVGADAVAQASASRPEELKASIAFAQKQIARRAASRCSPARS